MIEVIHHYVEANGELPSKDDFERFRKLVGLKVESRPGGWKDQLKATIHYRRGLGLTEPTELPSIAARRGRGPRQIKVPVGGIPGASSRLGKGRRKYSEADCVAAVRRYLKEGERPHRLRGYRAFAKENGLPAPRAFNEYGGWRELRARARASARGDRPALARPSEA